MGFGGAKSPPGRDLTAKPLGGWGDMPRSLRGGRGGRGHVDRFDMLIEVSAIRRPMEAEGAVIGLLPRVSSEVDLKVVPPTDALPANGTAHPRARSCRRPFQELPVALGPRAPLLPLSRRGGPGAARNPSSFVSGGALIEAL